MSCQTRVLVSSMLLRTVLFPVGERPSRKFAQRQPAVACDAMFEGSVNENLVQNMGTISCPENGPRFFYHSVEWHHFRAQKLGSTMGPQVWPNVAESPAVVLNKNG